MTDFSRLIGKHVLIYDNPITRKKREGWATIQEVLNNRMAGSRRCIVIFDKDTTNKPVKRWVCEKQLEEYLRG